MDDGYMFCKKNSNIFVVIFFAILLLGNLWVVNSYTKIGAGDILNYISNSHIYDCRDNINDYNDGHVIGAQYFNVKQWYNDKLNYVNQTLTGLYKENILFYSGNDYIKDKNGQDIYWAGYYASIIAEFIEILPHYSKYNIIVVSEDITVWLQQNPQYLEKKSYITVSSTAVMNNDVIQFFENLNLYLFIVFIVIVCLIGFFSYEILNRRNNMVYNQKTVIKNRKKVFLEIKELLNLADDEKQSNDGEQNKKIILRRRR